jgi:hypothetical protein
MLFSWPASNSAYVPLLSWKKAQDSVPWNIILLLGGGFAMAKGCEVLLQSPEWIQGDHDNSTETACSLLNTCCPRNSP